MYCSNCGRMVIEGEINSAGECMTCQWHIKTRTPMITNRFGWNLETKARDQRIEELENGIQTVIDMCESHDWSIDEIAHDLRFILTGIEETGGDDE